MSLTWTPVSTPALTLPPGSEEDEIARLSVSPLHPPLASPLVDAEM